ncbi:hypothetical protein PR048_010993 [Dryococelus australis]|uniref:Uncharacterized protein n=1 Tax=Dryococelus australis TaxID=614101 RepID=A0ABQ9HKM9_9NEOP|nr:hypothetical protein PR048_010993 [Dryococelus australis]
MATLHWPTTDIFCVLEKSPKPENETSSDNDGSCDVVRCLDCLQASDYSTRPSQLLKSMLYSPLVVRSAARLTYNGSIDAVHARTWVAGFDDPTYHQGEPSSIPSEVATGFPLMGIVSDDDIGWRVSLGISLFPPPFHYGNISYSPRFTLICGQNPDFKCCPNLCTPFIVCIFTDQKEESNLRRQCEPRVELPVIWTVILYWEQWTREGIHTEWTGSRPTRHTTSKGGRFEHQKATNQPGTGESAITTSSHVLSSAPQHRPLTSLAVVSAERKVPSDGLEM